MHGLILFAHGARDPRWAEPLHRLRDRVAKAAPDAAVAVAFLEIMPPDMAAAADSLVAAGCTRVTVVPIFLGQGGHVRRDLAALLESLAARHPRVDIRCATAVGENDAVLDALAVYCLTALDRGADAAAST